MVKDSSDTINGLIPTVTKHSGKNISSSNAPKVKGGQQSLTQQKSRGRSMTRQSEARGRHKSHKKTQQSCQQQQIIR